jgi:hypothetical protein
MASECMWSGCNISTQDPDHKFCWQHNQRVLTSMNILGLYLGVETIEEVLTTLIERVSQKIVLW